MYAATAPRDEYAELIADGEPAPSPVDAAGFRRARARVAVLAPERVRVGYARGLRDGAELLVATWRDLGLAAVLAREPPYDARLITRATPPPGAIAVARSRGPSLSP